MEFEDLRAFVAVAEAGSVSGAARELYVTQSAVTRRSFSWLKAKSCLPELCVCHDMTECDDRV
jgi:regulatory helix-turn-helix LysR family protein